MKNLYLTCLCAWFACVLSAVGADELLPVKANANFNVRNRKVGELLRPRDASNRDGTPIVLYPGQPWKCMIWRFTGSTNDAVRLQNQFTSKSLAGAAKPSKQPAPLEQVPCAADAHDAPAWQFTRLADGAYRIGQPGTEMVWTALKSEEGDYRVMLERWHGADEQKWELLKAPEHPTM